MDEKIALPLARIDKINLNLDRAGAMADFGLEPNIDLSPY